MSIERRKKTIQHKFAFLETAFYIHTGIIGAVYMIYLLGQGLSLFEASMVSVVFNIASLIFEVPSGILCDVWGKRKTALCAGIFLALAMMCFFIGNNVIVIMLGQFLWGLSYSLESGTIEAWAVNEGKFEGKELDSLFAFSTKIQNLFFIAGSFIGSWCADYSLNSIWIVPFLSSVVFIVLVCKYVEDIEPSRNERKKLSYEYRESLAQIGIGVRKSLSEKKIAYIYGFSIIISFLFTPLLSLWSVYLDKSFSSFSYKYLAFAWIALRVGVSFGGQLLEIFSKRLTRQMIIICSLGCNVITIGVMNICNNYFVAVLLFCMQEICWIITSSVQKGMLNDYLDDRTRATMISFSSLLYSLGKIVASMLFALVAEKVSMNMAWNLSAFLCLVTLFYCRKMFVDIINEKTLGGIQIE